MRSTRSKTTTKSSGYAKTTKVGSKGGEYRSAVTGRFIGEQGRRATVARTKPSSLTIRERKAI